MKRDNVIPLAEIALMIGLLFAIASAVIGALACAFSGYTAGQLAHDFALLVLGLGALVFAAAQLPGHARIRITRNGETAASTPSPPPVATE
jgi:ABC-type dipeptide/oligopeptide/nickel transport system permease subunit